MVQTRATAAADDADIPRIPLLLSSGQESIISPIDRRSEAYRHKAKEFVDKHPPPPERQPILNVSNILTFLRLVLVPVLLALWETTWTWSPLACGVVFIVASLTDWLDGYLARRLKIATVFGAFLDPVADKVMVATALILLTTQPPEPLTTKIMVLPVAAMICREITMSAIREWAATAGEAAHKAVKVNSLGKWKTALQMVSMSLLLVLRQPLDFMKTFPLNYAVPVSYFLLWVATGLALWSLAIYFSNVWTHFIYPQGKKHH